MSINVAKTCARRKTKPTERNWGSCITNEEPTGAAITIGKTSDPATPNQNGEKQTTQMRSKNQLFH
jgi:hypothetical protein